MACALLAVIYFGAGQDVIATGFLVFTVGEGLIVSSAAMSLTDSVPSFGSGAGLWAAGLTLVSLLNVFPAIVRLLGLAAALLLAITAIRIFLGDEILPTTSPLPFFAYPLLVATMVGWIWSLRAHRQATIPG